MKFLAPLLFISIFFASCDKYHARKLSGTYRCQVHFYSWIMNQGVVSDTIYSEDLDIQQDGKNLIVLQNTIPIDSVWKGKEFYQGDVHDYLTVRFRNDSIYVTRSSGGLGGNGSRTYAGVKKK